LDGDFLFLEQESTTKASFQTANHQQKTSHQKIIVNNPIILSTFGKIVYEQEY
jgi:hypothetical protein